MKTKNKILSALLLTAASAAFADSEEGIDPSVYGKSFLVCMSPDASLQLTASLKQGDGMGIYEEDGIAEYTFQGKNYTAKYDKYYMALRYGSRGGIKISHQTLSEAFTPFELKVSYDLRGPNAYYPEETSINYKGTIKTPSGPRLLGQEIPVTCRIISALSMSKSNPNEF